MKRKLQLFGSICILLLGCTKDFDGKILDTFDFSFSGNNDETGYVYEELNTSFLVNPEKQVENASFKFSYIVTNGEGHFEDADGNRYDGEEIELKKLNFEYMYVPTEIGTHTVMAKATDHRDNTKEVELTYNVDYAPFTAILKAGTNKFIVNRANELLLIMVSENTSEALKGEYKIRYSIDGGIGALKIGEELLEAGEEIIMEKGNTELSYLPTTLGTHTIMMVCTSPDGFERTVTLDMKVENVTFFVTADPKSPAAPVGEVMQIDISLETTDLSDEIEYEIVYYFADESEGVGRINDSSGEMVESATEYPIEPGSYTYSFNSEVIGRKKIYFDVSDSNNQIKRDSVEFDYSTVPFRFTGSASNTDVALNQNVPLNFTLSNDGAPEGITYQYAFRIPKGSGVLRTPEGNAVDPATPVQVLPGAFGLHYTPQTLGETELEFIVTDSFGQDSEPVIILLNVGDVFGFSVVSDKSSYQPGENANLTFNVSGQGSYTATYDSTNDGILTYNNTSYAPGSSFPMRSGTSLGSYQSFGSGNHELSFTVLSDTGATRPGTVSFTFEVDTGGNGPSLSVDASTQTANVGDNVNIDFDVEGSGTYTASYTTSNTGAFVYNGASIVPGSSFEIVSGASQGIYNGSASGIHNIDFRITSDTGETASDGTSIAYNAPEDNSIAFTASEASGTSTVGNTVAIDFSLTGNESYTATYTNSNSGSFTYNGSTIAPGQSFSIATGNSSGNYSGSAAGTHALAFSVVSNTGASATDGASISYDDALDTTIVFSANAASNSAETGNSVNIDFDLQGNESYTANYSTSSTGSFSYNGNTIAPGESFAITTGSSAGSYSGSVDGIHNINFNVSSNTNITATDGTSITCAVSTVAVTGVAINDGNQTIDIGGTATFTADITPSNANANVTWSSSDAAVSVDANGTVTGISEGTAVITATAGGFSDTVNVTVNPAVVAVTSVSIDQGNQTIDIGNTATLTATVTPGNANANVTWSSNNGAVSVDANGTVTGISEDTAVITATAGGFSDTVNVTVNPAVVAVTGVSIDQGNQTIEIGNTFNFTASVSPGNASNLDVTWSSNDTAVTVDANGTITGVSEGSAVITATGGGFSDTVAVTVNPAAIAVTSVSIDQGNQTIDIGNTFNFTASVSPGNATNPNVTWSSNSAAVTVSNGTVTGVSEGTATITATAGGFSDTVTVAVNPSVVAVTGVSIDHGNQTIDIGNTFNFTASVSPGNATNPNVTWSSNSAAVTVSNGTVTGVSEGTATITATAGGFSDTVTVAVNPSVVAVTGVSIDHGNQTIDIGNTFNFTASVSPGNATNPNVTWSSNSAAVTVSNGTVTGVSQGTATVTATAGGFSDTVTVTVNPSVVAVTGVSIDQGNQTIDIGNTFNFTASVSPGNATNPNVTWSSNSAVVTVSNGTVTGASQGTATITATAGGFSDTVTVTVNPAVIAVTGVSIDQGNQTIEIGNTFNFTASVSPGNATNQNVTWSSNSAVVTVSNGVVTGASQGTATITATAGGFSDTVTVTVNPSVIAVTGVSIDQGNQTIEIGNTFNFTASVSPGNATNPNVTWSSNSASVSVSNGTVTGVSQGTATITATAGGFSDTVTVTVNPAVVAVTGVSIDQGNQTIEIGNTFNFTASVSPGNATNPNVTWSSNSSAVSVSNGTVTGVSQETATITATAGGFSDTVNVTVSGPNSTITVNNWSANETEEIGPGGSGSSTHQNINISTNFMHTPLSIRAEVIEQIASPTTSNQVMPVTAVRIDDLVSGPNFLNQSQTIPNGTNFTIYVRIPTERTVDQYERATTTVRFYISNSVETITRDVTYRHL